MDLTTSYRALLPQSCRIELTTLSISVLIQPNVEEQGSCEESAKVENDSEDEATEESVDVAAVES
jgi:hypothetical protein